MTLRQTLSSVLTAVSLLTAAATGAHAQARQLTAAKTPVSTIAARPLPVSDSVIGLIDENKLTRLEGNTRPEALIAANDRGPVDASLKIEHILLALHPTPEKDAAYTAYVESLHDPKSPNFHKWLTAESIGTLYGPSKTDLAKITDWLTAKGFTIEYVYPMGSLIAFSGTANLVENAFHTSIHKVMVEGKMHQANVTDPSIPAALTSVVTGIVSLHDLMPKTQHRELTRSHYDVKTGKLIDSMPGQESGVHSNYTFTGTSSTYEAIVPGDLSQIYRLFKLFNAGISGQGQTIAVIEDSNLYKDTDVTTFQDTFGLTAYGGTHSTLHPTGGTTCTNPGVVAGTDGEVSLDVEYALATAPSSTVVVVSCKDSGATFGGLIALNNLLTQTPLPGVVSISYGESEAINGATANATYNTAYKNAVALGVSVFVSSGDEGAASSDANKTTAGHGITVSGFASTPYNVAVGGTDFRDTYDGTNSTYWNLTPSVASTTSTSGPGQVTNAYYQSALSYIPETPWADSCANYLLYTKAGFTSAYSTLTPAYTGYCNSAGVTTANYLSTGGGSGGPSGCATGTKANTGVANGTCKGYAKPSWQTLVGVPADGVRGLPDVSLFAANGVWGHYYPYCYTNASGGGTPCTGAPSTWAGAGGTSFASPILAAMQALINQKTGTTWGNPNPVYYAIAGNEYGTSGNASCDSSLGPASAACVFHDVTFGDIDVNCSGTAGYNCYRPTGTYGILSTSTTAPAPAYSATVGWDFATGIGSVNAQSLVNAFVAYLANSVPAK